MTIRSVVFDVDDTLYLERDYVRSGFSAVSRWLEPRLDGPVFLEMAWRLFEDGVRGDVFDRVLQELCGRSGAELIPGCVEAYRHHVPDISLLPDARACLQALEARVAIVTDGPSASQSRKVSALGLSRWCDPIVLTADIGPGSGKPHPHAFQLIESKHATAGADFVYVADNPIKDFSGPRALGWHTVRVRRPLGLHESAASGPDVDAEITNLGDLPSCLARLAAPVG